MDRVTKKRIIHIVDTKNICFRSVLSYMIKYMVVFNLTTSVVKCVSDSTCECRPAKPPEKLVTNVITNAAWKQNVVAIKISKKYEYIKYCRT